MANDAIALGNSLAPLAWHLRVNFDIEDTSVFIHPRQREGLTILERCYEEHVIISEA